MIDNLVGRSILVIDDDIAVLKGMQELLGVWECQVHTATSMEQAIEVIENNKLVPDIIVADYRLPGNMNGIQAVNHLRKDLKTDVPAILVTGDTSADSLNLIQQSGYSLLYKPLQPAKLRALLSSLLPDEKNL